MRRLRLVAGWFGLAAVAVLVALLFVSVRAAAADRERALEASEAAIQDLRDTRDAFRRERAQLHGQVDELIAEVGRLRRQSDALRRQVEALRGQVVGLGGSPRVVTRRVPVPVPQDDDGGGHAPGRSDGRRQDRSLQSVAPESEPTHPGCVNGRGPKVCR